MPATKPWWRSKTFWFNAIALAGSLCQLALTVVPVSPVTPTLVAISAATNIVLRFKTSTALTK